MVDTIADAPPRWPAPRLVVALVAFALLWFCGLDSRRLVHPDEGRYAEIAREMAVSGDWLTPRLNGIKYFEKPALQYWITAATFDALGVRQWTARLWPALAGFLGVLFIGYTGYRIGGSTLGLYAAAALGGSVWWIGNAHILTLDAGLAFWMALGLGSFLIAQCAAVDARGERAWMLVAWAALALAVLSKGLIGIVLPGAALVLYSLFQRDAALWRRLHLVAGTLVFLAIAAPWFIAVSRANPEFFDFFFIHEHFTRFLTHEARREAPWWYFVPLLAIGLIPWLPVFVLRTLYTWRTSAPALNGFRWQRFALIWAAFIFVFFSVSGSKLPSYILPMFPALALVIGAQLANADDAWLRRVSWPLVALAGLGWLVLMLGWDRLAPRLAGAQPPGALDAYAVWLRWALGVGFAGGLLGLYLLYRSQRSAAVLAIALATLAAMQLVLTGHDTLAEARSSQPLLARIQQASGPLHAEWPFYSVRMYDQTLPYYLARTVTPVEHPDEMAMGIASEPGKAIASVDAWRPEWIALADGYAIMPPGEYDQLRAQGLPMRELGHDTRRVIVARR